MTFPRAKRPPPVPHDWRRLAPDHVGEWGFLQATGPRELSYAPGGSVVGPSYECARCGVVRLYADFAHVDDEGDRHWRQVALYGLDWESLTPMHAAPSCEVLAWPALADAPATVRTRDELQADARQGAAA